MGLGRPGGAFILRRKGGIVWGYVPAQCRETRTGGLTFFFSISRRYAPLPPYSVSWARLEIYPAPGGAGSASKASAPKSAGVGTRVSRSARVIKLGQGSGARVLAPLAGSPCPLPLLGGKVEAFRVMLPL